MMSFNPVKLSTDQVTLGVEAGVALITLNRPEQLNALTSQLISGLVEALAYVAETEAVSVAVVTGKGKAFSVGVDLKELTTDASMMSSDTLGVNGTIPRAVSQCPKPIIGAINGFAVTGGFELALYCDFLYAAESVKFADTHARVGLLPGWGLSQKLPRLIGINRARELSWSGNYFSAQQACEWGLVNKVFADDQLLDAALDMARQISTANPDALYRIKAMMNEGWEMSLGEGLQMESERSLAYNTACDLSVMEERLANLQRRASK
ncbi:enoyl-CoA hydratase [Pseudomaricurvus alkylphenolicus]|uniref:enoyl-CoA hydratase n=1 Tax=Pseudomaricurvus alkylphenolicus TaxID=1306991 RepID=UPI001F0DABF5|nr:enoyl-CoA hydratase [Pseudomaricurvus alkylphenolicus]